MPNGPSAIFHRHGYNGSEFDSCASSAHSLENKVMFGILGGLISLVTILSNFVVFLAFRIERKLRRTSNFFLLSISVTGCINGLFCIPLFVYYMVNGQCWHRVLLPVMCQLWLSLDFTCGHMVILSTLYLIMDRFASLSRPLDYWSWRSDKKITIILVGTWLVISVFWFSVFFSHPYEKNSQTCDVYYLTDPVLSIINSIICFYIPFILMTYFYYRTYRLIRNQNNPQRQKKNNNNNSSVSTSTISATSSSMQSSGADINDQERELFSIGPNYDNIDNLHSTTERTNTNGDSKMTSRRPLSSMAGDISDQVENREQKALRTINFVFGCFLFCYAPFNVVVILVAVGVNVPELIYHFSYSIWYLNATFNPFLYAYANDNFKKTFKRILLLDWHKR